MKAQTIPVSELEKFMKIHKLETEVRVEMANLLELSKLKLRQMEKVKNKLDYIKNFKGEYKLSKEVKEMFMPYGTKNITIKNLQKALGIEEKK